jgi:hypothetical protein
MKSTWHKDFEGRGQAPLQSRVRFDHFNHAVAEAEGELGKFG